MSAADRWERLENRISVLSETFLPAHDVSEDEDADDYDHSVYDNTVAFILLAHAAIESYIEDCCEEAVDSLISRWKRDGPEHAGICIFIGNVEVGGRLSSGTYSFLGSEMLELDKMIDEARTSYGKILKRNNGLREGNLRRLLLPLGFSPGHLDYDFVHDVDAFGRIRGQHAHDGLGAKVYPDPTETRDQIDRIMKGLKCLKAEFLERFEEADSALEG